MTLSQNGRPSPLDELYEYAKNKGTITYQEVTDRLVEAGIKGILSFSPRHLSLPKGIVAQYVDLTSELQTLLYFMNQEKK